MIRVLSIDLPWGSKGVYGFAWVDTSSVAQAIDTHQRSGAPEHAGQIFQELARRIGRFDLILVDQPLGGANGAAQGYRNVERAFGNSAFLTNGCDRLQAPRFQPGARHAAAGLMQAQLAADQLGTVSVVVVESFPQLSILPLLSFARSQGIGVGHVQSLNAHKTGAFCRVAANELTSVLSSWTGCGINGAAASAQPDAVDAALALLPAVAVVFTRTVHRAEPIWLHALPPGSPPLPSTVGRAHRQAARALWMSPVTALGSAGIRTDGILSPRLPDWNSPAAPARPL